VTYRPIDRQRLGKHIPAEANASNNRTSITRQQISEEAFSTTEMLYFLCGPCRGDIKLMSRIVRVLEMAGEGDYEQKRIWK
jgi:hypothetical protein